MLAWSLQCLADNNTNCHLTSSKIFSSPNYGTFTVDYPTVSEQVEAYFHFIETNHPPSIVTHPDTWHPENAQCFLVTGTSLTKPVACDKPLPMAPAIFWWLIRGNSNSQQIDKTELLKRRKILMQIVSEEEPELLQQSDRESFSKLFELLIPDPMGFNSFDVKYICRIENKIAANPRIRERILKAIAIGATNSVPEVSSHKE